MKHQLTIAVADSFQLSLTGMVVYLTDILSEKVILQRASVKELVDVMRQGGCEPELCILVFHVPDPEDAAFVKEIKHYWPSTKVIAVLGFKVRFFLSDLFKMGILGCLYLHTIGNLQGVIDCVLANRYHFNDEEESDIFLDSKEASELKFSSLEVVLIKYSHDSKELMKRTGLSSNQIRAAEKALGTKVGIHIPDTSIFYPQVIGADPLAVLLEASAYGSYS